MRKFWNQTEVWSRSAVTVPCASGLFPLKRLMSCDSYFRAKYFRTVFENQVVQVFLLRVRLSTRGELGMRCFPGCPSGIRAGAHAPRCPVSLTVWTSLPGPPWPNGDQGQRSSRRETGGLGAGQAVSARGSGIGSWGYLNRKLARKLGNDF